MQGDPGLYSELNRAWPDGKLLGGHVGYGGEHVLPEGWWDGLPPLAKAIWTKTFREHRARNVPDPAAAAWDKIRAEWAHDGQGWVMKTDLPGYSESDDGQSRLWMGIEGDWMASSHPPGSLDLPGNVHLTESEVEGLPEDARKAYEAARKRMRRHPPIHAHAVASNALRAEFEKTRGGWARKVPRPDRRLFTTDAIEAQRPFFDELARIEEDEPHERIAETEYPDLPDTLKALYKKAYRCALRKGLRSPAREAWLHVIRRHLLKDDGTWEERTEERELAIKSKVERLCGPSLEG